MAWYIAKSLEILRAQLNARAPNRSTASDGGIGDAAHSARLSDHNPTASGQVCARDFTNDPAGGCGGQWLADTLVAGRDPRIKYIIFNHRILDTRPGQNPWRWMPYSGTNAHEHHVHVSVFAGALGDDTRPWNLGAGTSGEEDDVTPEDISKVAAAVWDTTVTDRNTGGATKARELLQWGHFEAARGRAEIAGLRAALAASTKDPGITEARLAEIVDNAIEKHIQITGTIEIGSKP